mmetsp:Transcript_34125/g.83901  ORF Transcript_34125/g.83901 Transcript_34125/m.83901 type:complete len:294 (+) Transcript_34125:456-1337(+)
MGLRAHRGPIPSNIPTKRSRPHYKYRHQSDTTARIGAMGDYYGAVGPRRGCDFADPEGSGFESQRRARWEPQQGLGDPGHDRALRCGWAACLPRHRWADLVVLRLSRVLSLPPRPPRAQPLSSPLHLLRAPRGNAPRPHPLIAQSRAQRGASCGVYAALLEWRECAHDDVQEFDCASGSEPEDYHHVLALAGVYNLHYCDVLASDHNVSVSGEEAEGDAAPLLLSSVVKFPEHLRRGQCARRARRQNHRCGVCESWPRHSCRGQHANFNAREGRQRPTDCVCGQPELLPSHPS